MEITVGERIMILRTERQYSREQLAELADISAKFLYEIEVNKKGFSSSTLVRLADALEVSLDYVMLGRGSRKYDDEIITTLEKFRPNTLHSVDRLLKEVYEIYISKKEDDDGSDD